MPEAGVGALTIEDLRKIEEGVKYNDVQRNTNATLEKDNTKKETD